MCTDRCAVCKTAHVFCLLPGCMALGLAVVACPFFFPTERISIGWPFPARLPLGAGLHLGHVGAVPSVVSLTPWATQAAFASLPLTPCRDIHRRFHLAAFRTSLLISVHISKVTQSFPLVNFAMSSARSMRSCASTSRSTCSIPGGASSGRGSTQPVPRGR